MKTHLPALCDAYEKRKPPLDRKLMCMLNMK
jgi:hypothetical protein